MSIIEIGQENRHLHIERGFLVIQEENKELARLPFDSVDALVITSFNLTYTHHLLKTLCINNIPLVICGDNFHPLGMLLNSNGHYRQAERLQDQINASKPLIKNLWRSIIEAKIVNQGQLLQHLKEKANDLFELAKNIPSGDSNNTEGIAAQRYWPRLLGEQFRRDPATPGLNSCLNYGYTILRAAMARSVVAAGLNPAIGIHHCNQANPFQLVDDLMEPFRPFVDRAVKNLPLPSHELTPEMKRTLAGVLNCPVILNDKIFTLQNAIQESVWTFAASLSQGKNLLLPPRMVFNKVLPDDAD